MRPCRRSAFAFWRGVVSTGGQPGRNRGGEFGSRNGCMPRARRRQGGARTARAAVGCGTSRVRVSDGGAGGEADRLAAAHQSAHGPQSRAVDLSRLRRAFARGITGDPYASDQPRPANRVTWLRRMPESAYGISRTRSVTMNAASPRVPGRPARAYFAVNCPGGAMHLPLLGTTSGGSSRREDDGADGELAGTTNGGSTRGVDADDAGSGGAGKHASISISSAIKERTSRRLGARMWRQLTCSLRAPSMSSPLKKRLPPVNTSPCARTLTMRDTLGGLLYSVLPIRSPTRYTSRSTRVPSLARLLAMTSTQLAPRLKPMRTMRASGSQQRIWWILR